MFKGIDIEKLGSGGAVYYRPLLLKNKMIFGNADGYIFCLDKNTGEEKWKYSTGKPVASNPTVINDSIFVGSNNKYLHEFNEDGKLLWKFKTGGAVNGIIEHENKLIFGSADKNLYALDKQKREILKFRTGGKIFTKPTVKNEKIYFGSNDGYFYCINFSGEVLWKFNTGSEITSLEGAYLDENGIYFGAANNYLYCLDYNGQIRWRIQMGDILFGSPQVHKNFVYAAGRDGDMYCLDKNNGKAKWVFKFYSSCVATPMIKNNKIYFASSFPRRTFYALNMEGKKLWDFKADGPPNDSVMDKNQIYFGCTNGKIYCLSKQGEVLWSVIKGSGKMTDATKVAPPPKIAPKLWEEMKKAHEESEITQQTELGSYDKGTRVIRDQVTQEEYASLRELGGYQKPNSGVTQYTGLSDEEKRKKKKKEKEEFFLRRSGRM